MVPVWEDGVDPNFKREPGSVGLALNAENAQSSQLQQAIKDRDGMLEKAGGVIQGLEDEIKDLKDQLQKANAHINALMDSGAELKPNDPEAGRQSLINEAVKEILLENNPDDLTTGRGLPRLESISARCGIEDVNSKERDAAIAASGE